MIITISAKEQLFQHENDHNLSQESYAWWKRPTDLATLHIEKLRLDAFDLDDSVDIYS